MKSKRRRRLARALTHYFLPPSPLMRAVARDTPTAPPLSVVVPRRFGGAHMLTAFAAWQAYAKGMKR
jgi:hypothetical protein